jgi:transposase-like protein
MLIEISQKEIRQIIKVLKSLNRVTPELNILRKDIKELKKSVKRLQKGLPPCKICGSRNVIKRGTRKTKERGRVQKYGCLDCGNKYSTYGKLDYRMRGNEETIKKAMFLRKKGLTFAQIAEELGGKFSRQTIHKWINKFQPPTQEKIIKRKQRNQFKEYERKFKIKV